MFPKRKTTMLVAAVGPAESGNTLTAVTTKEGKFNNLLALLSSRDTKTTTATNRYYRFDLCMLAVADSKTAK